MRSQLAKTQKGLGRGIGRSVGRKGKVGKSLYLFGGDTRGR